MPVAERMQPLLGTFVSIRARFRECGASEILLRRGMAAAFAAIARVHRLMSSHEETSDVARINRAAPGVRIAVDPWTWAVLRRALEVSVATNGMFDCCVAPQLKDRGLLPRFAADSTPHPAARYHDLELLSGDEIRLRRPLHVTLDGIAKGFAVDRAIAALRDSGATAGVVNAGGDLRLFGSRAEPVHLRDPRNPSRLLPLGELREVAVATSAPHVVAGAESHIDPRSRRSCVARSSATVIARDCVTADALTKPLLISPSLALPAFARLGAKALLWPQTSTSA